MAKLRKYTLFSGTAGPGAGNSDDIEGVDADGPAVLPCLLFAMRSRSYLAQFTDCRGQHSVVLEPLSLHLQLAL